MKKVSFDKRKSPRFFVEKITNLGRCKNIRIPSSLSSPYHLTVPFATPVRFFHFPLKNYTIGSVLPPEGRSEQSSLPLCNLIFTVIYIFLFQIISLDPETTIVLLLSERVRKTVFVSLTVTISPLIFRFILFVTETSYVLPLTERILYMPL